MFNFLREHVKIVIVDLYAYNMMQNFPKRKNFLDFIVQSYVWIDGPPSPPLVESLYRILCYNYNMQFYSLDNLTPPPKE